jgi:benzoylformate decarboxylase
MQAQMYADLVAFAEPVTKMSTMVLDHRSLLRTLRRAIKEAYTPPMGPVYVCLPADILDMPAVEDVCPTFIPSTRIVPDDDFIKEAAAMLASAEKPMIYVGDGVSYSHAQEEVAKLAETLGAEVWGVDNGEMNISFAHPLWMGQTGHMFGDSSLHITSKGDVNFVCGTYMVPEVFPELGPIFAPGAKVVHVDLNSYFIAQNHTVDLGVVSDPKLTIERLLPALEAAMTADQKAAATRRAQEIGAANAEKLKKQKEADIAAANDIPLKPAGFMKEMAENLPSDAIIFDDALTCSPDLTRYMPPTIPDHFLQNRGGSLGVGIPGAIGAKLAYPDKTVVCFTGDGGSMYSIPSLWTAARYNIDIKVVICNNHSYKLLKYNIEHYWREIGAPKHDYPSMFSFDGPVVDFALLACSMGVSGVRVATPSQIAPAVRQAMAHEGPFLIDLVVTDAMP